MTDPPGGRHRVVGDQAARIVQEGGKKWTPALRKASLVIGYGLCAAFASIPLAVLLGFIKP